LGFVNQTLFVLFLFVLLIRGYFFNAPIALHVTYLRYSLSKELAALRLKAAEIPPDIVDYNCN